MTDTNLIADGRLEFRRTLPSPVETVWRFLTEDELRGQWLCRGDVEPRAGGRIAFKFDPEKLGDKRPDDVPEGRYTADFEGTVVTYDPPRTLAFLWPGAGPDGETLVTMSLKEVADGTELHLVHERITSDSDMVGSAAGWHTHLERLECRLSRALAPNFWTRHDTLESEYRQTIAALRAKSFS
ncbi:SRPBCC family protein [Algimonas porphyrae]|uniref:ATPase n=1 Tax=Algimonas porphyrae TaxID=1128113 RepID=A0ABQ5V3G6_9PROT|nr:SRPBCC family protein [Algimonas porphyrae]GLQ21625.1 ATPase [Algimonas porphyrae]